MERTSTADIIGVSEAAVQPVGAPVGPPALNQPRPLPPRHAPPPFRAAQPASRAETARVALLQIIPCPIPSVPCISQGLLVTLLYLPSNVLQ